MSADMPRTASPTAPLGDLRVLDLCRFLAGPFATRILSDLGADVIRVLPPNEITPKSAGGLTMGEAFDWAVNHDKRDVAIDLRTEEGRSVLFRLVAEADVLVENFRPGVLDRLGCGYS